MAGEQVGSPASGGEDEADNVLPSPQDYVDFLDANCANAMLCGMTYDQYWHGDVEMLNYYYDAYFLRKERESEEINQTAWLNGLYYLQASQVSTEQIMKSMSGKKSKKMKSKYPEQPIDFKGKKEKAKKKKIQGMTPEQRAEQETAQWMAFLQGQCK